jgi:RHS repeat-associated protein
VQSPDTGTTTYQYDAAGRRWKTIPADGRTSEVTFDLLDRPTQVRAWHPGQGAWQYADYGYDTCTYGQGRLCTVSSPGGWIGYGYKLSGELASELTVIEAAAWTAQHAYDVHGRRTLTSYTGGVEVSYGYDAASRVNNLQAKVGGTWRNVATNVTYDAAGRMTALTHGNGIGRSVSYDWDGRVQSIAGSLSPQNLEYGWNAVDLITGITNHAYPSLSQGFDYDALSRLTDVVSASGNHGLDYDANGNRTFHTWGGATDSYGVSSTGNRLDGISATGTRARSYAHDAAGHRTAETIAGNTINHVYDGFARPASRTQPAMSMQQSHGATVSLPAGTWSYGHDGMGRRTFKRAPGNVLTRYLHGAEGTLQAETSPGGTSLTSIYLWLNGQPIGLVRGGQVYHVHADHLGRPEMLTNASKAIVWRAENLAFDRKVATSSIGEYNLGFPGQYYDAEGASWQNWFRTYDGSVGRYTQSDPIGLAGGLNTYVYATNNSVSYVDPTGEAPWLIAMCVGAGVSALIDLGLQLWESGGELASVGWGSVSTSAATGAAFSGLGPTGALLGRGGTRASQYGYSQAPGILNRGGTRFGWSYNASSGQNVLSLRVNSRHFDVPRTGVSPTASPVRDGAVSGGLASAANAAASGDGCGCSQ